MAPIHLSHGNSLIFGSSRSTLAPTIQPAVRGQAWSSSATIIEITFVIISTVIAFSGLVIACLQHHRNQWSLETDVQAETELQGAPEQHLDLPLATGVGLPEGVSDLPEVRA
jgi:hypothetical protein